MRWRDPDDPDLGIRTTRAYLLSVVFHVLLATLFVIAPAASDQSADISGSPETVTLQQQAPQHEHRVVAKAPPTLPKAPIVAIAAQKFIPRPRELTITVPSASPMPTPLPQASPLLAQPASPVALPSASIVAVHVTPLPTVAPTAAPTSAPTAMPTQAPSAHPSPAPTVAPTAAPTLAPKALATVAPSSAPTAVASAAPKSIASGAPRAIVQKGSPVRGTPGPNGQGSKATVPARLITVAPTPRPVRARATPKPRPTPGMPGNLNSLIPHNTVLPQPLKHYGPNYGAMSGGYVPTPPPDIRDQTQYIYRTTSAADHLEMWVTRVTSGTIAARCTGWLVRFPAGPPSQAGPPSHLAPTIIFGGGGGPTQAGRAVDPIVVGMATITCRRSALTPFHP